ncbi:hypothetical protein L4G92_03665 [Neisseria sp. ZJ106]|uniref:Uncharacterized protein n=1 Tax=Neisseria lisongii TaxID=2912188 RepID=A0ABY7RLF8_9NEIS|nr:hypothetical protein [Neisseria lisongii]MCF7521150.1 hypothetical protein [Neisseria lisongii]WCL72071.1 hypothetical protein PJU73_02865 [Neisseria lisongii]
MPSENESVIFWRVCAVGMKVLSFANNLFLPHRLRPSEKRGIFFVAEKEAGGTFFVLSNAKKKAV